MDRGSPNNFDWSKPMKYNALEEIIKFTTCLTAGIREEIRESYITGVFASYKSTTMLAQVGKK